MPIAMHNVSCRPFLFIASIFKAPARRTMATRTYNDAIDALNSLQTPFEEMERRRKAGIIPDETTIAEMKVFLTRIGYQLSDLDRLNIIHVAGTKGKGSTCAYVDAILSQYHRSRNVPRKTGLFISPHLIAVRERIRINSAPISEALFTKYFFQVWDRLGASTLERDGVPLGSRPTYARYLTLMSWHAFLQEGVDIAVYETGVGGEYDVTNLVQRPLATGISALGIDHVNVLGETIEKIAWHKAGIMKTGSAAFSTTQVPSAAEVLEKRAEDKQVDLVTLDADPRLQNVQVKPDALFQKRNATLSIALVETAVKKLGLETDFTTLPREFVDGLETTAFRGRCEVKQENDVTWYLDGAHTADSLKVSAAWFASETSTRSGPKSLIFNQQGRTEAIDFLQSVHDTVSFDHVIFCSNVTFDSGYKRDFVNKLMDPKEVQDLTVQHRFAEKWKTMNPSADVHVLRTIQEALDFARAAGGSAYVTGSLHLVGGALGILDKADAL